MELKIKDSLLKMLKNFCAKIRFSSYRRSLYKNHSNWKISFRWNCLRFIFSLIKFIKFSKAFPMKAVIQANSRTYNIQIDQPLDISIPLRASKENVNAWYLPPPKIYPSAVIKNWTVVSIKRGCG